MAVQQIYYEELLSACSQYKGALALLKQYRPYLETLPSMRRPSESIVPIPLPNIRVRQTIPPSSPYGVYVASGEIVTLPCDVVFLMCDPDWKIKTGVEIFVFIHRPQEDFSDLLRRWRQTQIFLDKGYEWLMPPRYQHLLNDGAEAIYPLFVVFPETPKRIKQGLKGACLPVVSHTFHASEELAVEDEQTSETTLFDDLGIEELEIQEGSDE